MFIQAGMAYMLHAGEHLLGSCQYATSNGNRCLLFRPRQKPSSSDMAAVMAASLSVAPGNDSSYSHSPTGDSSDDDEQQHVTSGGCHQAQQQPFTVPAVHGQLFGGYAGEIENNTTCMGHMMIASR